MVTDPSTEHMNSPTRLRKNPDIFAKKMSNTRTNFKHFVLRAQKELEALLWICWRSREIFSVSTLRWSHTATINQDNRLSLTQNILYSNFNQFVLSAQEELEALLWICWRSRDIFSVGTLRWSHTATINQDNRLPLTQNLIYHTVTLISPFSALRWS